MRIPCAPDTTLSSACSFSPSEFTSCTCLLNSFRLFLHCGCFHDWGMFSKISIYIPLFTSSPTFATPAACQNTQKNLPRTSFRLLFSNSQISSHPSHFHNSDLKGLPFHWIGRFQFHFPNGYCSNGSMEGSIVICTGMTIGATMRRRRRESLLVQLQNAHEQNISIRLRSRATLSRSNSAI